MEDLKMLGKTQLVNNYAEKFGTSRKDAEQSINNVLAVIKDGILNDGGVNFIGDFNIKVSERKARDYKNPATGEIVHKDAFNSLKIKVGSNLKKELNK